jgi:hypothetical protein
MGCFHRPIAGQNHASANQIAEATEVLTCRVGKKENEKEKEKRREEKKVHHAK